MMVLIVTACPAGLRGDLTKWLMEIAPGVFVGRPSARIRDVLWNRVILLCKDGRALLVFTDNNEQGIDFRTHRHDWRPTDFDGVVLMNRPHSGQGNKERRARTGWSDARRMRKRGR